MKQGHWLDARLFFTTDRYKWKTLRIGASQGAIAEKDNFNTLKNVSLG